MTESKNPLLSIIVPTFNGERFIACALESIIEQKIASLEVIVIDGASSDGTMDIVRSYADRYPFIKFVSEKDSGQSDAMNKGLKMARGKYLGFLNDDDYYSQGTFQEALAVLENSKNYSLVVGNCFYYDETGRLLKTQMPALLGLENYIFGVQIHPANSSQYFYHRTIHDVIGYFPEDEHLAMDLWFYLECCSNRNIELKYVDKNWGNFRLYKGTKTFDNNHAHGAIKKKYRLRYFKKMKIWLALVALIRSAKKRIIRKLLVLNDRD